MLEVLWVEKILVRGRDKEGVFPSRETDSGLNVCYLPAVRPQCCALLSFII